MGRVIAQEHAALWGGLVDLRSPGPRRVTPLLISCGRKFPAQTERIRLRFVKGGDTWLAWCANASPPATASARVAD